MGASRTITRFVDLDDALGRGAFSVFNVKQSPFEATGDGVTDDSTVIQAAIDAASAAGGGTVLCPPGNYKCNVTLKQGVLLLGQEGQVTPWTTNNVRFTQAVAGYVVDTPAGQISGCGVVGIGLHGIGAGTAGGGIRFRNVVHGKLKSIVANSFADEGVLVQSSCVGCALEDVFTQNCVLNRSRAAVIGAVDVHGADHFLSRIEATISGSIEGTVQSVNLYCVGMAIRMANGMVSNCIGELSDVGVYVSGSQNRFSTVRADLNYGHGWLVVGTLNSFSSCLGLNNSQDTTNTYDNWNFTSTSGNNTTSGCMAQSSVAKVARYGFNDLVSSAGAKNFHTNPNSVGAGTAQYLAAANSGSAFKFASGTQKTLTANSATPDVTGYERFITANTAPTTITDFTGAVQGQKIVVFCNDVNTTVQHNGATIVTFNSGDVKLVSGRMYTFVKMGAVWRQVIDQDAQVSADNGDAAKTLQARKSETTQKWATALTANRAVTLSGTGVYNGAKFRIVRTAASTGAFTLDVGTGPLKSLAVGQWCEVEYDGAAWMLTAFGAL